MSKYVECEKYDENKDYECDTLILSSSWGGYPEKIKFKECIQMIHANYKELLKTGYKYVGWNRTTRHIAVSNAVADNFYEIYGIKCDIIYNLLDELQETKPILKLISATRLSAEKGYKRMLILANKLKDVGIKFRWTIFTDLNTYNIQKSDMEEMIYMKSTYDIFDYIKEADYGVQLSDTEGYSYFVNECLQYGTPMLCTNFDSVHESVKDGYNGYILNMNMDNLDLDKIINEIPRDFEYIPKTKIEDWTSLIGNEKFRERKVAKVIMKVEITREYDDTNLKRRMKKGEILEVDNKRCQELINANVGKLSEVKRVVEDEKIEIKPTVKKNTKKK